MAGFTSGEAGKANDAEYYQSKNCGLHHVKVRKEVMLLRRADHPKDTFHDWLKLC